MSTNKNAILRYQVLDRCFRNPGKRYYISDLLDECTEALMDYDANSGGIKKRQLYEDIRFMESSQGWSIPLDRVRDGQKTFLRYEDMSFSINNQPMNETEAEQLKSAILVLRRFKGMPQFEWVNELIPKLDQSFGLSEQQNEIMSFESNEFLAGLEFLSNFFKAIQFRQSVVVTYKSFRSAESSQFIFHPYYLKQYNNRWFVFGKRDEYDNLTNLALDRCLGIKECSNEFDPSQDLDFEEYFDDFVGVTKTEGNEMQKIVLKATGSLPPYIISKPIHSSQTRIEEEEENYVFSIKVIPNYELEKLILSFGEDIEVLEPINFRNKIRSRMEKGVNNYN